MESIACTHERCNCCAPSFPCSPGWGWQRYRSYIFVSPSSSSLVHTIYYVEKEPTTFNNERRRPRHLLLRDGVHRTWELEFKTFSHERWSPQHSLPTDGVHNINTQEMEFKAVIHERWSPKHLITIYGVYRIYTRELASILFIDFGFLFVFITNPQHLQRRGGVHSIYEIWSPQHWLPIYGIHSIYSWEMECTVYTHERWIS